MHSIWAVAVNTLKQALRMKIAAVFTVLLMVLLPVMGLAMTGDGTLKGRLQTFVSYGLSLTSLLLCLLTIVVTVYSLTSDIKHRQIYTVITKPIRRYQLLLGKLLGVILLDVILLFAFSAIIYSIIVFIPKFSGSGKAEIAQVQNEFFAARVGLTPAEADVTDEVDERFNELKEKGLLPKDVSREKIIAGITEDLKRWKRAAVPGQQLVWNFHSVKPIDPNQSLFIRFKYDVSVKPPDLQVLGKWIIGDDRQVTFKTPIYPVERKDSIRTFHEIEVPADAVASDGYLAVGFLNDPRVNQTVVIFPPKDGLEVLYKADTFTANFIRVVILILFRLMFLACLGILTGSFLSFPVAILFCLVVFFTGTISGFCLDSFQYLSENATSVYYYTVKPIIHLLPQFDKFSPSMFLVPARLVSWSLLIKVAGLMVCVKGFLLLLLALLIFSYSEIAKIII